MVLADKTLFIAGPPDIVNETEAFPDFTTPEVQKKLARQRDAIAGTAGGAIHAVSAEDGTILAKYATESLPVWDGMIAAGGKLYFAALNGSVTCLGE